MLRSESVLVGFEQCRRSKKAIKTVNAVLSYDCDDHERSTDAAVRPTTGADTIRCAVTTENNVFIGDHNRQADDSDRSQRLDRQTPEPRADTMW